MKTYQIFFFILLFTLNSCKQRKENNSNSILVNVKLESKVSIFDLFERIEIIPLETTKNSLINYVNQVDFFEGRFYVFDRKAMRILIFDSNGKHLGDVGKTGNGPGEYFNIGNFVINKHKNVVEILTNTGTIHSYDFKGVFIDKHQIVFDNPIFHSFYPINKDEYLMWNSNSQTLYMYSTVNERLTKNLYEEKKDKEFSASVIYKFQEELYFTRSMSNEVYKLSQNGDLEESYKWDFGIKNIDLTKCNLPSEFGERDRRINKMFQDSEISYIITGQLQNSICYYAKLRFNMEDYVNVFYLKKETKQLVFNSFLEGLHFSPLYWTDDFVIGLANVNGNMAVSNLILDEENATMLSYLNEESNPCLVKYYFRSGL
jgi:hypothetical protein